MKENPAAAATPMDRLFRFDSADPTADASKWRALWLDLPIDRTDFRRVDVFNLLIFRSPPAV